MKKFFRHFRFAGYSFSDLPKILLILVVVCILSGITITGFIKYYQHIHRTASSYYTRYIHPDYSKLQVLGNAQANFDSNEFRYMEAPEGYTYYVDSARGYAILLPDSLIRNSEYINTDSYHVDFSSEKPRIFVDIQQNKNSSYTDQYNELPIQTSAYDNQVGLYTRVKMKFDAGPPQDDLTFFIKTKEFTYRISFNIVSDQDITDIINTMISNFYVDPAIEKNATFTNDYQFISSTSNNSIQQMRRIEPTYISKNGYDVDVYRSSEADLGSKEWENRDIPNGYKFYEDAERGFALLVKDSWIVENEHMSSWLKEYSISLGSIHNNESITISYFTPDKTIWQKDYQYKHIQYLSNVYDQKVGLYMIASPHNYGSMKELTGYYNYYVVKTPDKIFEISVWGPDNYDSSQISELNALVTAGFYTQSIHSPNLWKDVKLR